MVKKGLKFFVFGVLISCIATVMYLLGVNSSQDDIVFELSYDEPISEYYVLREDNTLMWCRGFGHLGNKTFGMYFSDLDEQGFVKVSDEEAREMKRYIKKSLKYYDPVPSNASINVCDGGEVVLKYKNKYYNDDFPKKKYEYQFERDYPTFYGLRKKLRKFTKECAEEGAYVHYEHE